MTIAEVPAPFGVAEDEFVAALSRDLRAAPNVSASRLTASEDDVLRQYGGISRPVGDERAVCVRR